MNACNRKPKNARSKRALDKQQPQVFENAKKCIFMRGHATSQIVNDCLRELYALKKPDAVSFTKKNSILPFEDAGPLEFLSRKNDASLFVLANHTKKRPNNLVVCRMFDTQLLDMLELHVTHFKSMHAFEGVKSAVGNRPLFIFNGEAFSMCGAGEDTHSKVLNMLVDMFRGEPNDLVSLNGLQHVISVSSAATTVQEGDVLHMRVYTIQLLKSGSQLPRVELQEMGPAIDFRVGRTKFAPEDVRRASLRIPKETQPKKIKNVTKDAMGDVLGRVYVQQDLTELQTRKVKALKRPRIDAPESEHESDA